MNEQIPVQNLQGEQNQNNLPNEAETKKEIIISQKTITMYFEEFKISDQSVKESLLTKITDLIYDRNNLVVQLEKEQDEYKKEQMTRDVSELESKIKEKIQKTLNPSNK